jgi:hypothetical protein
VRSSGLLLGQDEQRTLLRMRQGLEPIMWRHGGLPHRVLRRRPAWCVRRRQHARQSAPLLRLSRVVRPRVRRRRRILHRLRGVCSPRSQRIIAALGQAHAASVVLTAWHCVFVAPGSLRGTHDVRAGPLRWAAAVNGV